LKIAQKYFGFAPDDEKLVSLCEDAYAYVQTAAVE